MKIQFYIGTDISSEVLDFCVLDGEKIALELQIKNNPKALNSFFKKIRKLGATKENTWCCAEHTGVYGNNLRAAFEEHEFIYSMVPAKEIKQSIGMVRGKNDKIDAKRISQYCKRFNDKLKPSRIPKEYLLQLKQLFNFRKRQVKNRTQAKNYLKSVERSWESKPQKDIISEVKKQIRTIDKLVDKLDAEIKSLINQHPEAKKNYQLITSVPGIGMISACYMLICTENFNLFDNPRKFASYTGVAPFENSSGKSFKGKTTTCNLRNKEMKSLLFNGVSSILRSKNELGVYYRRRVDEGKHKNKVKNAVVFKMISRVFATIKRQSPYIQIDRYRVAC